ncbi:MAG TPA: DUF308 domain-containing protein [Candidatus Aphodovivens excrementavium]|nr:DUF308 domain-containing protein [Candidatus Aphodovivens excrementavium]
MYGERRHDWGLIVAGALLVICAFVCLLMPGVTLVTITLIAGATFLVSGIMDVVEYVRFRDQLMLSGWVLVYAILDILIGVMFALHPLAFSVVLPWLIGGFFIVFGVFEVVTAFKARRLEVPLWGWGVFSGVVGVVCGLTFFLSPATLSIFIALFMIMRGASLLVFGWNAGRMQLW